MTKYVGIYYYIFLILFVIFRPITASSTTLPRYATIKFNEVNARTGPTEDCPIEWVFIKKNEPIEIIAEYDQWYKIRDINNEGGWVKSRTISKNRFVVLITNNITPLLQSPKDYNKIIAQLSPNIRCKLHKCVDGWCKISCQSYTGWVVKKLLWGLYPND